MYQLAQLSHAKGELLLNLEPKDGQSLHLMYRAVKKVSNNFTKANENALILDKLLYAHLKEIGHLNASSIQRLDVRNVKKYNLSTIIKQLKIAQ